MPQQEYAHRAGVAEMPSQAMKKKTTLPNIKSWQASHLQLITFPVQSPLANDHGWWEELTGSESSAITKKPNLERTEQGIFDGVSLSVTADPMRLLWTASPFIDSEHLPESIPTLGTFTKSRDWFVNLMERWMVFCPPINRLALCGRLVQFTKGHDSGYQQLADYLPSVKIDLDSSDFMYRVNRKVTSRAGAPEGKVNRLATWAFLMLTTRMNAIVGTESVVNTKVKYATCLDFDINTIAENKTELDADTLTPLLKEFSELATNLAKNGDVL